MSLVAPVARTIADEPRLRATASPPMDEAGILTVEDVTDLAWIHDHDIQGVCLRRQPDPDLEAELAAVDARGWPVGPVNARNTLAALEAGDGLEYLPQAPRLRADIVRLATVYTDLIGCPETGLRFVRLEGTLCPRFHIDRVGVRLLCTYRGPGTQWGRRDALLPTDRPPASPVGQARAFDVLLLKGSTWPENAHLGAVHRSPAPGRDSPPRLLLSIDAVWNR